MPNCVTHFLHAKQVLNQLPEELTRTLNKNAYFWAAQGPDFLFCHRYLPFMKGASIQSYGSQLHKAKPSDIFRAMRSYVKQYPKDPIARSYALGFVNHYALDSICHPYIKALAKELRKEHMDQDLTALHAEVESSLDTIMLRRETGKLPSQIKLNHFFPKDEPVQREISKIYSFLIERLFDTVVKESVLYQSTKDTRIVFSLLTDSTGLKRKLISKIESGRPKYLTGHIIPLVEDAEIDFSNISGFVWTKENGEESKKSFFELFDEAQNQAKRIIVQYETCDFSVLTGEIPMG